MHTKSFENTSIMAGSPASDLYSVVRNVVLDREVLTAGGFVSVISSRDIGFRFSAYSDVLFDWPLELSNGCKLQLTDKLDLHASDENDRFSVSQISPGYYNMNLVAFYVLKGRLLIVFHGVNNGLANGCSFFPDIEPQQIASTLDEKFKFDFRALFMIMSARAEFPTAVKRADPKYGLALGLYCEASTMPKLPAEDFRRGRAIIRPSMGRLQTR
jgi:hypothetical protein